MTTEISDLRELLDDFREKKVGLDQLVDYLKDETKAEDSSTLIRTLKEYQLSSPLPNEVFEALEKQLLMAENDETVLNTQISSSDEATIINTQLGDSNEETIINTELAAATDEKTVIATHDDFNEKTRLDLQNSIPNFDAVTQIGGSSDETRIAPDAATKLDTDGTVIQPHGETEYEATVFNPEVEPFEREETNKNIVKERFILEDVIGAGGMGTVYRARDLRKEEAEDRNPYVALKVMNDEFKRHPDAFKAMQRETQKSQNLAHPNIITVFDFDRDANVVYMTMELLEGQTLKEFIRDNPAGIPKEEAKRIVDGVSQALAYAHKNDIVHSDLKPGNVFIGKDGKVKVLDFGIARAVPRHEEGEEQAADFDAGTLGALTPSYASLEMIERQPPHPSDDIYALGVITYELLTGQHPYQRLSADKVIAQGLKPKPLANLKRREWAALSKSLAVPRDQRIQDIHEFITDFVQPRSLKGPIIIGTLTIALLASTVAFFLKPEGELPPPVQELTAEQLENITNMLETADLYMTMGQLATPPGDSALDLYNRVIEMDPFNTTAIDGKTNIADEYEKLARSALKQGDRDTALAFTETGLVALPTHESLKELKTQLAR